MAKKISKAVNKICDSGSLVTAIVLNTKIGKAENKLSNDGACITTQ